MIRYAQSPLTTQGPPRLREVTTATRPIARQRCQPPNDREHKKRTASQNLPSPCNQCTQRRHDCRRTHSRRPHQSSRRAARTLHRSLLGLHSEKRQMFKEPPQSWRVPFGVPGSSHRVEPESNPQQTSHKPMRNTMRKEIKKKPSCQHRGCRKRASRRRPRRDQGNASPDDPGDLYNVPRDNRNAAKDSALGRNREVRFR